MKKVVRYLEKERRVFHFRMALAKLIITPLPLFVGGNIRTLALRAAGFRIGKQTVIWGPPEIVGLDHIYEKLVIGSGCHIGARAYFDLAAEITLEDHVVLGPEVMMLTGSHHTEDSKHRAGPIVAKPICVKKGSWLGARSTILPGVTIGSGVIVAAGAVVTQDVPPNTMVAGIPAVVKRHLPE